MVSCSHLYIERLWYVRNTQVNQLAHAEDEMLEDDDEGKPQGEGVPGQGEGRGEGGRGEGEGEGRVQGEE